MARFLSLGIWVITIIAVFLVLFSNGYEFDSNVQDQHDSAEKVGNRQFGPGLRQSGRRAGGTIKYKKISVMKSGSGFEKPDLLEVPDTVQNKTRRLKPKTSNRHTMIYRPTKKIVPLPKKNSFELSTATTKSPEVKIQGLPDKSGNYGSKSWLQVQPVTEIIDSFIRPTKRNRVRVNDRPSQDIMTTTLAPKVTMDPLRPISRVRSGSITTTTLAPTTSKFLRLSRKPNRWQSNLANRKKLQQSEKEPDGDDSKLSSSVVLTTESKTIPEAPSSPKTNVIQLKAGTVVDNASKDAPEFAEIEHDKEESSIRKIAAKPDKIEYFEMSESVSQPKSTYRDSSQVQERTVRPRVHVPKKDSLSTNSESQRAVVEPILLQTKEQREQQQLQKNDDALYQLEVSVQFPRVRQRIPQSELNTQQQQFETVEETKKIIENDGAEKNKQLDRFKQSKVPGAIIQFREEYPRARVVPSRTENQDSLSGNSASVKEKEESVDFIRVPPSDFGQRLPSGHNSLPQFDSRPPYNDFEASYSSPGKVEKQRYIYNPSVNLGTHSNYNQERHHPENTYHTPPRPNGEKETYRRPEVIYLNTTPRPDEEKYLRPEVIYASRPKPNEDRRTEVIYTTPRPKTVEDRRPDIVYQTSPRPVGNEEKHRRPDIIYTPPQHEYQPPATYLKGQVTYPRVSIAFQPVSSTIPPPPVTYEPPHLEFMPPSASPPPRIYVPPVEEYKPPSTTAVIFQSHWQEEKTPSAIHSQRFEDPRVLEGIRKLEAINSYTRLVSVGHPSVKQLPYPPERNEPYGSHQPGQQPEPIVITVTENPYRSYEWTEGVNEKGEQFLEKPLLLHGNYQRDSTVGKSHFVESTYTVSNAAAQVKHERLRPNFDGSSVIVGKPYSTKDEEPVKIHLAAYTSYDRPNSESLVISKSFEGQAYLSNSGEINPGQRLNLRPPSATESPPHQSHQINQPNKHYAPDQSYQSYQSNEPIQSNQPQQPSVKIQPLSQSKEPRKLRFPSLVSEKPYVIHLPGSYFEIDNRYENVNVIPVSDQPQHKHFGPPADEIAVHTEKPPQDVRYNESQKPITVTVRPHGVPSLEPERNDTVYQSEVPDDQSSVLVLLSETKTNMAKNQNLPLSQLTKYDQQTQTDVHQKTQQYQPELPSSIPASFYPIGPVRAYQVTQAIYPSPPPRFFQLPGPLPNPFESQFTSPSSPSSSSTPPPIWPSLHPPPSSLTSPTSQQPNSFENHLLPGDTWTVNPLFQNKDQFLGNRPFPSNSEPLISETPHSSERVVQYRPASFYDDNERLNRSPSYTVPSYQQQPQLLYDSPIVIQESYRLKVEDLTHHHQPSSKNNEPIVTKQILNRTQENRSNFQPQQIYNHQEEDYYDRQQQSERDFSGVEGTPGVDYPILHAIPTNLKFKCELVESPGTRHPAYYADPYTRCQVFHVCQSNRAKNSFLCPNGTIFNQKVRVCDWWHNVQCDESSAYYSVNTDAENYQLKFSTY